MIKVAFAFAAGVVCGVMICGYVMISMLNDSGRRRRKRRRDEDFSGLGILEEE